MEIKEFNVRSGATMYVGEKADIKAIYRAIAKGNCKFKPKYPDFPVFADKREIYGVLLEQREMTVVNSDNVLREIFGDSYGDYKADFECYGVLKVEGKPRSIFDHQFAGCNDKKGNYYVLMSTRNGKKYCIPSHNYLNFLKLGNPVKRETWILGVKVRPMTFWEEEKYNTEDAYFDDVDLWGNIRA